MRKIVYILMMSVLTINLSAQKENTDIREGNKLYKSSKFTEAEVAYRKALLKNNISFEANYNLGNALFKQKKYQEALEQYNKAISINSADKIKLAAAFHNVGNSLLVENNFAESIDAFKKALKLNPADNETRYNLAYAQAMFKNHPQNNNNDKNKETEADRIKKKADELVEKRMYKEAYDLMKDAEKKYPDIKKFADYTKRIQDVVNLNY